MTGSECEWFGPCIFSAVDPGLVFRQLCKKKNYRLRTAKWFVRSTDPKSSADFTEGTMQDLRD